MARSHHRGERHPALAILCAVVLLILGFAPVGPVEAAESIHGQPSGIAILHEQPAEVCGHDCSGALLPCAQHASCSLVALPALEPGLANPVAVAGPGRADRTLEPHFPTVLLHPPDRLRI